MAATHRISRTQGNTSYHAHSFVDFEAKTVAGGATSGQTVGVSVGIVEKDDTTDVVAVAAYSYEVPGGAAASVSIHDACRSLAALIQTGIGADGICTVEETSEETCRINVLPLSTNDGYFADMTLPTLVAPV